MNILCNSIYRKSKKEQNQSRALEVRVVTTLGGDRGWKGDTGWEVTWVCSICDKLLSGTLTFVQFSAWMCYSHTKKYSKITKD